jgi:hypothetical protein
MSMYRTDYRGKRYHIERRRMSQWRYDDKRKRSTRKRVQATRARRIKQGLCGRCGKEPLTTKTLGERCGFYHKLYECGIQP